MKYILHIFSGFSGLFVSLLSNGGYTVLALVLLFEALPVIGSFLPGHVVIIAAGFLVRLGVLNLWVVLISSLLAVMLGDILGFLLGRRYGYNIVHRFGRVFSVKAEYIDKTVEKTKRMIDTHTGKTIVFGKFSPITRPFTSFLVGASGVHTKTFWVYDIMGSLLWVVSSVLLGYIFGLSYHAASHSFGRLLAIAVVLTILIVWAFRVINTRFHVFRKYELFVLGLNVISLWILAKTIQDSFSLHSFMSNFDIFTNLFMADHVGHGLAKLAGIISTLGGTAVMIFLGLCIGTGYLVKKKWRRAGIILLTIVSTSAVVGFMKDLFMRVRPKDALMALSDPSFPSGHASLSAAFFVALLYVTLPHIHSLQRREGFIVLCVLFVILIGLSRVVLNVHWASDVIAGWALGIFLATGSILFVRYVGALLIRKKN